MIALNLAFNKSKLYKFSEYWCRDIMLNFEILEKDLGIVVPPHFVHDFSIKIMLMLYFINWPKFSQLSQVVYTWNFIPGRVSSLSMVKCLLLFTRFCRDEISSQDEKRQKRSVNTSSGDEILKWVFFKKFLTYVFKYAF